MQEDPKYESRNKQALTVLITIVLIGLVIVGLVAAVFLFLVSPN